MRVAIIPARGGSRRIPRKNIRQFFGRPIIAYSIECAYASKMFDFVFVSTDDDEISRVAQEHGANVLLRDASYAEEHVGTQDVAKLALQQLRRRSIRPDYACVLYATAPLMRAVDIERGYDVMLESGHRFSFSVGTAPLCDAGQFYWGDAEAFLEGLPIFSEHSAMVPIAPDRVCDINTEDDFERALMMYERTQQRAA